MATATAATFTELQKVRQQLEVKAKSVNARISAAKIAKKEAQDALWRADDVCAAAEAARFSELAPLERQIEDLTRSIIEHRDRAVTEAITDLNRRILQAQNAPTSAPEMYGGRHLTVTSTPSLRAFSAAAAAAVAQLESVEMAAVTGPDLETRIAAIVGALPAVVNDYMVSVFRVDGQEHAFAVRPDQYGQSFEGRHVVDDALTTAKAFGTFDAALAWADGLVLHLRHEAEERAEHARRQEQRRQDPQRGFLTGRPGRRI